MPQQQNKINYQKELEKVLDKEKERVPTLLLHSCCAPCSSYVLEYLAQYFSIAVFYYNPNIYPEAEYEKRVEEQQRLIRDGTFCNDGQSDRRLCLFRLYCDGDPFLPARRLRDDSAVPAAPAFP